MFNGLQNCSNIGGKLTTSKHSSGRSLKAKVLDFSPGASKISGLSWVVAQEPRSLTCSWVIVMTSHIWKPPNHVISKSPFQLLNAIIPNA